MLPMERLIVSMPLTEAPGIGHVTGLRARWRSPGPKMALCLI